MVDATHVSFRADDRSYFSLLKKDIHNRVLEAGYGEKRTGEIDIVVSEMTSNLSKYAVGGEILLAHIENENENYFEIISIDNGPGMTDPAKMLADGYSSTNTLGHGLGSIKRLSDTFQIYSLKGWGTITLSRIYKKSPPSTKRRFDLRALVVAKPGEKTSGDGFFYTVSSDHLKILVADGLGHGVEANKAVNEAVKVFKECNSEDPTEILRAIHTGIRKTRGVVATVVLYNLKKKTWNIAGIGNISMKMLNSFTSKNYMPYNGIVGHNIPTTMKVQQLDNIDANQIILCSDGLKSRWDASKYPLINKYDLSILAAALYKDFARRTDDMSIVIGKVF